MSKRVSIWNNVLVQASSLPIVSGVPLIALNSGDLDNDTGTIYDSIRLTLTYSELTPDPGGSVPFQLGCTIQTKDDVSGNYLPLGYQFNPYNRSSTASERIIIVQPNMDTFNLGIDDIIFPLDREQARISREQGKLTEGKYRVIISLRDNDPTGPNAFVSVRISAEAELYNHV